MCDNEYLIFHDSSYCAFELCQASLDQFFLDDDDPKKFRGPMPSKKSLFLGLCQGMEFIHSKNLIYDDVNPRRIFIFVDSRDPKNSKAKWSVSSLLNKSVENDGNVRLNEDNKVIWKPPELLKDQLKEQETIERNIFAIGLVFAYVLLGGNHLYDSGGDQIINNMKNNRPVNLYSI